MPHSGAKTKQDLSSKIMPILLLINLIVWGGYYYFSPPKDFSLQTLIDEGYVTSKEEVRLNGALKGEMIVILNDIQNAQDKVRAGHLPNYSIPRIRNKVLHQIKQLEDAPSYKGLSVPMDVRGNYLCSIVTNRGDTKFPLYFVIYHELSHCLFEKALSLGDISSADFQVKVSDLRALVAEHGGNSSAIEEDEINDAVRDIYSEVFADVSGHWLMGKHLSHNAAMFSLKRTIRLRARDERARAGVKHSTAGVLYAYYRLLKNKEVSYKSSPQDAFKKALSKARREQWISNEQLAFRYLPVLEDGYDLPKGVKDKVVSSKYLTLLARLEKGKL